MRTLITVVAAGAAIALAGCSREERADTGQDVEAAAGKVASEAREALSSPEVKEVGAEIKEAAGDVGKVAKGAAEGAREAGAEVAAESREETKEAAR